MYKELLSDRLTLKRLTTADAQSMFEFRSNPDVYRYQGWEPKSVDEIHTFIDGQTEVVPGTPGKWFQYGIFLTDIGTMIGDLGLHGHDEEPFQLELGITIAPDFQGHGYAAEAVRSVLNFAFADLGTHRVYGSVDKRNTASIALMLRVGFRKEAHLVESLWFKGEWADDLIFGMLDRQWRRDDS